MKISSNRACFFLFVGVAFCVMAFALSSSAFGQEGSSSSPSDTVPAADPAVSSDGAKATCKPRRRMSRRCRVQARRSARRCVPGGSGKGEVKWTSLFDGKTLGKWKPVNFGGQGEVEVRDGMIVMQLGSSMTGISYKGELPKTNYELELEGQRLDGMDFFATTTFPVGDSNCSFVTGGWGGTVAGLSTVDFYDAADNSTSTFFDFKDKVWYRFRIRVSDAKIEVWIDDKRVVNQARKGHKIGIRDECDLCKPLGIATWETTGAVRGMRFRDLSPEEVQAAATAAKAEEF